MAERSVELLIRILAEGGQLKAVVSGAQGDLNTLGRTGSDAGKAVSGGLDGATASMRRLVAQIGAGYLSFQGLRALFSEFTRVATDFERARVQLNSLFGDAEKGQAAFEWVKQFAKDTPFELDGVLKSFQTLKNFGIDPMGGAMQAVADQASRFGGSQEQLQGISLALGQAWARQKLQGQDILQLINQGVPVWELLAQVTGKNTQELFAMSEAGELGRDVIEKFIAAMGEAAGGAAQAQMATFGGMVSNVKDAWAQFLDSIAQSGALDEMKAALDDLLNTTGDLADSGDLQTFAQQVGEGLGSLIGLGRDAAGVLADMSGPLKFLAELWVAGKVVAYANAIQQVAAASVLAQGPIAALGAAAGLLGRALGLTVIALTLEQIGKLAGIFIEGRNAARGMADAYEDLARKQQAVINKNKEFADEQVKTAAELATLSRAEQDAYAERLRAAQTYWKAVFELESRDPDGDQELARRANQQVRAYQQALSDIRPVLDERLRVEQAAADRVAEIKADETRAIEAELERQKEAYDAANDAIKAANTERDRLIKDAADLITDVAAPPAKKDPTILDALTGASRAESALSRGDLAETLRLTKATGDVLRDIAKEGKASQLVQQTAKRVADAQVAAATAQAEQIKAQREAEKAQILATMDELVTRAKTLEALKVGFDQAQAITDAQALRAALEAELAANPITVQVVMDTSSVGADLIKDATVTAPAKADGGELPGHSPHPRADNILYWGTAGEFLLPVDATRNLRSLIGAEGLEMLRRGRVPGYALGGQIGAAPGRVPSLLDRLPALPSLPAGAVPAGGASQDPYSVVNVDLGGRRFPMRAPPQTATDFAQALRLERLKS